jgi:hypothetical protein
MNTQNNNTRIKIKMGANGYWHAEPLEDHTNQTAQELLDSCNSLYRITGKEVK